MLDNIKLTISKTGFWFRKHSAELLVAGAIVSGAGAIVTAIISTKKLDKTLKPFNDKIDSIKKDLKLKDRDYKCKVCGLVIDRDYNASLNLANYELV